MVFFSLIFVFILCVFCSVVMFRLLFLMFMHMRLICALIKITYFTYYLLIIIIIIIIIIWSKRFDERPHRMSCRYWELNDPFHYRPLLLMEWSLLLCTPHLMTLLIFFCCGVRIAMIFYRPDKPPPKTTSCRGEFRQSHLIHGYLGPPEPAPKRHLDRFSRFCRTHERNQQTTDRPTDHATLSVNRVYAMRPIPM